DGGPAAVAGGVDDVVGQGEGGLAAVADDAGDAGAAQQLEVVLAVADGEHLVRVEALVGAERQHAVPLADAGRADDQRRAAQDDVAGGHGGGGVADGGGDRCQRLRVAAGDAHGEHGLAGDDRVEVVAARPGGDHLQVRR